MSTETPRILVVEDEESFVDALAIGLKREGFEVDVAMDGIEAMSIFESVKPDLILLDVMLPKLSGIDVCRRIRLHSNVPIIMVTAKSTELDTVVGLEVGADDYVSKPYRLRELVARIRAVIRRKVADEGANGEKTKVLKTGEVELNLDTYTVIVKGNSVKLPLKEFELLETLLLNAGKVVTRDMLIDTVWGGDYVGDTKTLDVHIKRLRNKIEVNPAVPELITTVRGVGYKFEVKRD